MRDKFWHFDQQFQKRGDPSALLSPTYEQAKAAYGCRQPLVRALRYCVVLFEINLSCRRSTMRTNINLVSNTRCRAAAATLRGRTGQACECTSTNANRLRTPGYEELSKVGQGGLGSIPKKSRAHQLPLLLYRWPIRHGGLTYCSGHATGSPTIDLRW
jgi:hypothetical protein